MRMIRSATSISRLRCASVWRRTDNGHGSVQIWEQMSQTYSVQEARLVTVDDSQFSTRTGDVYEGAVSRFGRLQLTSCTYIATSRSATVQ